MLKTDHYIINQKPEDRILYLAKENVNSSFSTRFSTTSRIRPSRTENKEAWKQ